MVQSYHSFSITVLTSSKQPEFWSSSSVKGVDITALHQTFRLLVSSKVSICLTYLIMCSNSLLPWPYFSLRTACWSWYSLSSKMALHSWFMMEVTVERAVIVGELSPDARELEATLTGALTFWDLAWNSLSKKFKCSFLSFCKFRGLNWFEGVLKPPSLEFFFWISKIEQFKR